MVHPPNLIGFGWLLLLASVLVIFKAVGADTQAEERLDLPYDSLLGDRLSELGIANWKELRQKSQLTTPLLLDARRGNLEKLTFEEVSRLAKTLNWTPAQLKASLGFLSKEDQQLQEERAQLRKQLQQQRSSLQQECQQLREQLLQQASDKEGEIASLQQESAQLREQLQEQTGEITSLQQESAQLHEQLQHKTGEITSLQQESAQLREQLQDKHGEITSLQQESAQLREQLQDKHGEITSLQQESAQLREQLQEQSNQLNTDFRNSIFEELQALLINYPSARQIAEVKPDLPAKNMMKLFMPLENMLQNWGYEPIASAWERVPYDPQLHQADNDDIQPGEMVYVRFVGYKSGDRVLCPAKVSRSLPMGIKPKNS